MNYLALCQRLRQEAGVSGVAPLTVVNQTGEPKRLVDWTASAYEDIQNLQSSWRFLRKEFSFDTVTGLGEYAPPMLDFASWRHDIRVSKTPSDESPMAYVTWQDFRNMYHLGSARTATGRPVVFSIKPTNALMLWPMPDDVYTISGEYQRTAHAMTTDTSEPIIPQRFRMIIVWRALMFYGAYAAAEEKYIHGNNEYKKLRTALEIDQIDTIGFGEPLA